MLKTIGIVVVAALAARAAGGLPAYITATRRRTKSAAKAGRRSGSLSATPLDRNVAAFDVTGLAQTFAKRRET
jgi:hypothetical protein